jgi:hypothetical protein
MGLSIFDIPILYFSRFMPFGSPKSNVVKKRGRKIAARKTDLGIFKK